MGLVPLEYVETQKIRIMEEQVIILGGGVSGLSLAWRLCTNGIRACVLESDSKIGGLAGTLREDGYLMDVGPHSFFSEDTVILDTVLRLFDNMLKPKSRQVKFYYQDRYLDYPLTAHSVLFQMGIWPGIRTGLSFLRGKIFTHKHTLRKCQEETVEDWAIESFGRHLYQTFFKPYTEQFWKLPCTELSSRSIPTHTRMSFSNTLRLLLRRRVGAHDESLIEREMLPTYYPVSGFSEIPDQIAGAARKAGAQIHLNSRAIAVEQTSKKQIRVHYEANGEQRQLEGSHVVSTIPLNLFVKMMIPPPPPEVLGAAVILNYRSLTALGMVTEKQNILNCGYIYVLNRPYNRITEMNEFSPGTSPPGENIIMVEIPCLKDSTAWTASKEDLFNMCIGSLSEDGFLGPGDVKRLLLIRAPHAYPVYSKGYATNLELLLRYVDQRKGVSTLGRTGEFIYMDVDKCMSKAFNFANELLTNLQ
jgi:protoporphyrinogen oxidase